MSFRVKLKTNMSSDSPERSGGMGTGCCECLLKGGIGRRYGVVLGTRRKSDAGSLTGSEDSVSSEIRGMGEPHALMFPAIVDLEEGDVEPPKLSVGPVNVGEPFNSCTHQGQTECRYQQ